MATRIPWTDNTINPGIYGCSPAGPGCRHCYAAKMAHRLAAMGQHQYGGLTESFGGITDWTREVRTDFDAIAPAFARLPKRKPCRVFCTSMGDLFHSGVHFDFIARVFLAMASRPHLTFQVLTKRIDRAAELMTRIWLGQCLPVDPLPPNIQIGYSASTQADLDRGVPDLLRVPAAVRFLSLEPLIEAVDLAMFRCGDDLAFPLRGEVIFDGHDHWSTLEHGGIDWIIVGAESGPNRRPCRREWVRAIVAQADAAGVPVFVKQLEIQDPSPPKHWYHAPRTMLSRDPAEWPAWARRQEFPEVSR